MALQYFSIDVECVATGTGHNDRAVAQIALVNQVRARWRWKKASLTCGGPPHPIG